MVFSTPTRTRLAGFCVTLSISFVGCAVTGSGDPFVYQAPAATESVIYHYRIDEGFRGSAIQWDVVSNEIPLTRIGKGGYFMETCAPSQRSYKTKKKADAGVLWVVDTAVFGWLDPEEYEDSIEISVEAGQSYFCLLYTSPSPRD